MKNNFINRAIGEKLKVYREKYDYSLQDVGERLGISRQTYYNFECGTRTISLDLLKRICMIYDADYLELLEEVHQEYIVYLQNNKDAILEELEKGNK